MTERDDRTEDRRRPAGPAWATVPTMQWSRVSSEEREGEDPQQRGRGDGEPAIPVSPAVGDTPTGTGPAGTGPAGGSGQGGAARGVARPSAVPVPPPAEASAAMRFVTRRPDSARPDAPRGDERPAAGGWWSDQGPSRDEGHVRGRQASPEPRADRRGEEASGAERWFDERSRDDERFAAGSGHVGRPHEGYSGAPGRSSGRASVPTAPPALAGPRPRQPVFVGPNAIPPGLRPDLVEALTAPTPPGGMRYEQPSRREPVERYDIEPAASAAVSAPPLPAEATLTVAPSSAPPGVDDAPSWPPFDNAPVSAPPTSAPPVSAPPISAPPVSAPPVSGAPAQDDHSPDPEQILSGWEWVFDPDTLREVAEDREGLEEIREALTAKLNQHEDNAPRARLLSLRAVVSRILGDLHKAVADGKLALAHAEATGELRRIAIAQARLAHVLQWRGEFEEADRLFALANSTELPDRLRATMHQHSGKCAYDQGRYIEACNHFEKALELRKAEDPEMIAQTELALDAVFRRVAENGWGPYPRTRDEILQLRRPPTPAMDERTGRWGFTDENGDTKIPALYGDVQPFRDGVAWVQQPGHQGWELIDESGQTLIPAGAGYLGVSSFSDGLAWVSRDGTARWIAIDKSNTVTISTGFEDVRPFRRGMAAVRRGGRWGAVDGIGRQVVAFRYDSFATALSDGRYIDGFSDEGLAVVELAGRKGVVDRAGRVLVEPVHPALVIHPVAFLITDSGHRWGALDRRGRMLISPSHPSRMAVTEEIDRLLVDARPML